MELLHAILDFWRSSPSTQLLTYTAAVLVLSGGAAALVRSQLRQVGLVKSPGEEGLDWAHLLGLLVGVWGLLLGGAFLGSWFGISGSYGSILGQVSGVMAGLTAGAAILAGIDAHARRQIAAAPREERDAARRQQQPVRYAAMLFAGLAVAQVGLTTPLLLIALAAVAVWAHQTPAVWSKVEAAFAGLRAGQSLRQQQLQDDGSLDDLEIVGTIGITKTAVRQGDAVQELDNQELLRRARAHHKVTPH